MPQSAKPPSVPSSLTDQYVSSADALITRVNTIMFSRSDMDKLVGAAPRAVVTANHQHHHMFMSTVFRLDNFDLMKEVVPWVYRAYRGRGFQPDYFRAALTCWQETITQTFAPTRAEPILAWYQWMLSEHDKHVEQAYSTTTPTHEGPGLSSGAQRFLEAALKGDSDRATGVILDAVSDPQTVASAYLDIVTPALREVGRLWETGAITVAHEHLVSSIANRGLAAIYHFVVQGDPQGHTCVVTAAPNEMHELGARMVADLLRLSGLQPRYLGANTPTEAVVALVKEIDAPLVAISVSVPFNLLPAAQLVAALRADPATRKTRIIVGGNAFAFSATAWKSIGADACGMSAAQAVDLANQLIH